MAVPVGTGPVLWEDQFPYADTEDIGTTAAWDTPAVTGDARMRVLGGQMARAAVAGYSGAYTTKSDFGDGDFIFRLTALPDDTNQLLMRVLGVAGAGTVSGGFFANLLMQAGNDRLRLTAGGQSTPVDVTDRDLVAPTALCIRREAPAVSLWHFRSGAWEQVGATASFATPTAGRIIVETNSSLTRVDAVEYRALTAAATIPPGSLGALGAGR